MSKIVKRLVAAFSIAAALAGSGYFGKQYFDEHYLLLNEEDMAALQMNVQLFAAQAYAAGKQACNKTT